MNDRIALTRLLIDFLILACCAVPLLIFHEFVKPYKRGFYCDDESIRYPYIKDSQVSRKKLIVVGLLIPAILILLTECLRAWLWERKCGDQFKTYHFRNLNVHRLIVRLYCFIGYFFIGVCFNQLMVDIAKYSIGRPRPHFIEVCKPNQGYNTCKNPDTYIDQFTCTGTDPKAVHEARLSFYSGHAAFSFYAAWYTSLYLQARLYKPLYSRLVIPVMQFALFGGACWVSYTRVSDYRHHWSDVLVGIFMGSAIGIFVAVFVAEVFKRREIPPCYSEAVRQEFGLIRIESPRRALPANGADPVISTQSHTITVQNEEDEPILGHAAASQRLLVYPPNDGRPTHIIYQRAS